MTEVDLTNCDREPIHIPGSIQPHGCLLVCDSEAVVIRRQSSNASAFLGLDMTRLNGLKLEDVMGREPVHQLRNALARSGAPSRAGLMPGIALPASGRRVDISVHRFKGNAFIEFEASVPDGPSSPLEFARTLVGRLSHARTPQDLIAGAARLLRSILQYDRVMIYQFAPDGSGKVVSEAKRVDLESFKGQHFPASDIPQQARQLYLANPIRLVSNSNGDRFAIDPVLDASGEPLDMSYAHLRSVSPIHCEYLRNMGVAASMSVSIIVDGALWGLVACHHYTPRSLPMNQRIAAEIFGEFLALQLGVLTHKQQLSSAARARGFLDTLLASASHTTDAAAFLRSHLGDFRELLPCDGVALSLDGDWSFVGSAPPAAMAPELVAFAGTVATKAVWATDCLSEAMPAARSFAPAASGVLAIPLSQLPRDYLFFFRKETVQTVEWAGDPNKTYTVGPNGDRLTPRRSFAIWKEAVEHRSHLWTPVERDMAESSRTALVEVVLRHGEMLAEERRKAEIRQQMLNQELNHRVKNILSVIKSIVAYPARDGIAIEGYVEAIKGRIEALSFAHDQAMRAGIGGVLSELFEAELSPYATSVARVTIEGPPVALEPRAFSIMALVVHELATNAAKYGPLSRAGGIIALNWERGDNDECRIVWRETGGPRVEPPTREGFGTVLVSRSIPFDLGGQSEIDYAPTGVVAKLTIPSVFVTWLEPDATRQDSPSATKPLDAATDILAGKSVLLVEDQFLIALDVEDMLLGLGASEVVVCSNVQEAMIALDKAMPDLALLDVNLGAETSQAVADRLRAAACPFVFATGYDDGAAFIEGMSDVPILRKPYSASAITAAIRML